MSKKTSSLLCVLIPFIIGISLLVSFIIASIIEHPTNRGVVYLILIFVSMVGSMFVSVPCGISSIIGVVNAVKLKKQGENTIGVIVIGIINIVASLLVAILWVRVFFASFYC